MARRTTMKSRSGTKLYSVRDAEGKFKDIQTYQRAHAADLRQQSKAEQEAAQGPIEKKIRKTANDAVQSVKSSVTGAVTAVQKAAKKAVNRVSSALPTGKNAVKPSGTKTARKPVAKKTAKAKKNRGRKGTS